MVGAQDTIDVLLNRLDDAFQSKARLGIMAALIGAGSLDFKSLKSALSLTDGNLSSHLTYLEKRGFVRSEKSFAGKRTHTELFVTDEGRLAFEQYIDALEAIIDGTKQKS